MAGAADAIGNLFNVTSKTFRTCECFMYLEKGEVHREQKEGYMTPPREPWAAQKALLRLFRMQATRPTVMVGAGRGGAAIECPALSDSRPEYKTTYDIDPHAEVVGYNDSAWELVYPTDLGGRRGGGSRGQESRRAG